MSTKKNSIEKETVADISTASFIMDAKAFNDASGETFGGGANVLKIGEGQAAGPFTIREIRRNVRLSKKVKKGVDVYVGQAEDGTSINLPAASSFVEKAKEAKVKLGDVIAVMRGDDYQSKFGQEGCQSFALKVLSRS